MIVIQLREKHYFTEQWSFDMSISKPILVICMFTKSFCIEFGLCFAHGRLWLLSIGGMKENLPDQVFVDWDNYPKASCCGLFYLLLEITNCQRWDAILYVVFSLELNKMVQSLGMLSKKSYGNGLKDIKHIINMSKTTSSIPQKYFMFYVSVIFPGIFKCSNVLIFIFWGSPNNGSQFWPTATNSKHTKHQRMAILFVDAIDLKAPWFYELSFPELATS